MSDRRNAIISEENERQNRFEWHKACKTSLKKVLTNQKKTQYKIAINGELCCLLTDAFEKRAHKSNFHTREQKEDDEKTPKD